MKIYNERFEFDGHIPRPELLLYRIETFLRYAIDRDADFLRYAIVESGGNRKVIEAAIITEQDDRWRSERDPGTVKFSNRKFVVANIVPTGVKAEVGGFIGDATPVTNAFGAISDFVLTHPNVLNAAALNMARDNILYTEGYLLDNFFRKKIMLRELLSSGEHNRIGVILDKGALLADKNSLDLAINTIETMRAVAGIEVIDYLITKEPVGGKAFKMKSGAFGGEIENPAAFLESAEELINKGATAIAAATYIRVSLNDLDAYFNGELPNPYGGTEALISHTISKIFDIPSAHAPILIQKEKEKIIAQGLVDPRMASEAISAGYLGCVLKGLHRAPQPVKQPGYDVITIDDIKAVVVPHSCCGGIPVLAAQEYGIPVIAVKENKTVLNVTPKKLGLKNVIEVKNYLEAFGVVAAMKAGVTIESVRRPFKKLPRKRMLE